MTDLVTVDRLGEIEYRLAEINPRTGREVWHAPGCATDHGYRCDCIRADVEWLVAELRRRMADQGVLL